jgi:peptide/nickel transport system substrate-binding protein
MTTDRPSNRLHPKVGEAYDLMQRGKLDRRGFVRIAALLGVGATAAYTMAGLPSPAMANDELPFPEPEGDPVSGGTLRVAMMVQRMDDPAAFSWTEMSNQARHIVEYMAMTGVDNVTRPMLARSWEASDDLRTWTFHLRPGVKWHNGDDFTAEDVKWNVERWTDPAVGSSNIGLSSIAALVEDIDTGEQKEDGTPKMDKRLRDGAIEVVDDLTIRFNCSQPVLSFPEDLYNYPAAIVHPSFTPPFSDNPIGTGPYTLVDLAVGERCTLRRVTEMTNGEPFEYWGGEVFLDEIHYYNFDSENQLVAFAGGDVDAIFSFGHEQMAFAEAIDGTILPARSAQTLAVRVKVDQPPFDNKALRQAMQAGLDRARIRELVFGEAGDVGEDHHVAPVHPEYAELPPLVRDVERSKELLAEAGYPNGIDLSVDVGNTNGVWQQSVCEAMRDQWRECGIRLNINVMPSSRFWEIWDKTPFGATSWTHRPLGTMVLSVGYRAGVPWNESNYNNPEFEAALNEAESILDPDERRVVMERVQKIMQDDAFVFLPVWQPVYTIARGNVHGYPPHPTTYHQFNKVWVG